VSAADQKFLMLDAGGEFFGLEVLAARAEAAEVDVLGLVELAGEEVVGLADGVVVLQALLETDELLVLLRVLQVAEHVRLLLLVLLVVRRESVQDEVAVVLLLELEHLLRYVLQVLDVQRKLQVLVQDPQNLAHLVLRVLHFQQTFYQFIFR